MKKKSSKKETIVIALGGNAISKPGLRGTIQEQFYSTHESMVQVAELAKRYNLVLTHGNGPQVGAAILRSELTAKTVYPLPIDINVADTQGGIGYMIQQVLGNCLRKKRNKTPVATVVTQVEVDAHDPAFENPTKPVGRFYSKKEAHELMAGKDWSMKAAERGWRRVVPSPKPKAILEIPVIKTLMQAGTIVIASGGGGVPVALNRHHNFYGTEAVIDKDLTSALLANAVNASTLVILTGVDHAFINFGKKNQKALKKIRAKELAEYLKNDEFAEGSMKPKIEACLQFLKRGGKRAIITSIRACKKALNDQTGTRIVP